MRKTIIITLVLCVPFAAGCSKGPAQAAIAAAEKEIETVRPLVETYAPQELQGLSKVMQSSKDKFDKGEYSVALAEAKEVPVKVQAAVQVAEAAKAALQQEWSALTNTLPGIIESIAARLKDLASMKQLPPGLDKAKLEGVKTLLDATSQLWREARLFYAEGQPKVALDKGRQALTRAQEMLATLGIAPDPTEP